MPLLGSLLPYGIAFAVLFGLWATHKAEVIYQHHAGYVEGKQEVQTEWNADKAQRKAERDAILQAWDAERDAADATQRKLVEATRARFAPLEDQAHRLPAADAHLRVPDSARRLLDDAVSAANAAGSAAEPARPAAGPAESAAGPARGADHAIDGAAGEGDSNIGLLTTWGVGAARLYRECRDRVDSLTKFYDGLRAAQPRKEAP